MWLHYLFQLGVWNRLSHGSKQAKLSKWFWHQQNAAAEWPVDWRHCTSKDTCKLLLKCHLQSDFWANMRTAEIELQITGYTMVEWWGAKRFIQFFRRANTEWARRSKQVYQEVSENLDAHGYTRTYKQWRDNINKGKVWILGDKGSKRDQSSYSPRIPPTISPNEWGTNSQWRHTDTWVESNRNEAITALFNNGEVALESQQIKEKSPAISVIPFNWMHTCTLSAIHHLTTTALPIYEWSYPEIHHFPINLLETHAPLQSFSLQEVKGVPYKRVPPWENCHGVCSLCLESLLN